MNKLKTIIVAAVIITLNSCYVQHQHSYTQEHTSSHYRNNFSRRDKGGCGWYRQQPNRVENRNYMREW